MKTFWIGMLLLSAGCAGFETVASNLTAPAGGAEKGVVVEEFVDRATEGTSLEKYGIGAAAASLLGLLGTYISDRKKSRRKRGELWEAIKKNGNA